nr:hypothetical protein [Bacteroidota bacterium]
MKNWMLTLITSFLYIIVIAQVPQAFKYQAVVRDGQGTVLANQAVDLQISILADTPAGNMVYSEVFNKTTNPLGFITVNIGTGMIISGNFSSIDWQDGVFFLKLEVDTGSGYEDMGTSPLLSVPFALYAETAGEYSETDPIFSASPAFEIVQSDISVWNTAYGWGDHALAGYITSESDPIFDNSPASEILTNHIFSWNSAFGWGNHALAGYLIAESDPEFGASPASGITVPHINQWITAYSWGPHGSVGYLTSENDPVFSTSAANGIVPSDIITWNIASGWGDHSLAGYLIAESDPEFGASPASGISIPHINQWNTAYAWGPHASVGYLISESDPVFSTSAAYEIAHSDIITWNIAAGWGNHALAGYLTMESDPVFGASPAFGISSSKINNWNDAYSWGDHALAGYLTSESDPIFEASPASGILINHINSWNTAYGWGNHALAGYLTSESDPVFGLSPAEGILEEDITNWNIAYYLRFSNVVAPLSRTNNQLSISKASSTSGGYLSAADWNIFNNKVSSPWENNGNDIYYDGGDVGIGTNSPHISAALDISSTNKGLLIPRLTTAQRTTKVTPANGLMVFDIDTGGFWFYDSISAGWKTFINNGNNYEISDLDGDTYITLEKNQDDDTARIFIAGSEKFRFGSRSIDFVNTGNSVYVGKGAGKHDDLNNRQNVAVGTAALENSTERSDLVAV